LFQAYVSSTFLYRCFGEALSQAAVT